jgi:hypothetical protein
METLSRLVGNFGSTKRPRAVNIESIEERPEKYPRIDEHWSDTDTDTGTYTDTDSPMELDEAPGDYLLFDHDKINRVVQDEKDALHGRPQVLMVPQDPSLLLQTMEHLIDAYRTGGYTDLVNAVRSFVRQVAKGDVAQRPIKPARVQPMLLATLMQDLNIIKHEYRQLNYQFGLLALHEFIEAYQPSSHQAPHKLYYHGRIL